MRARPAAFAAAFLAALAAAPSGAAGAARIVVVRPQTPLVGVRSTIEVRVAASRVVVGLVSPTGIAFTLPLERVRPRLWRGVFRFTDDGPWLLRVPLGRLTAVRKVLVLQPPSGLPPFRPKPSASTLAQALAALGLP